MQCLYRVDGVKVVLGPVELLLVRVASLLGHRHPLLALLQRPSTNTHNRTCSVSVFRFVCYIFQEISLQKTITIYMCIRYSEKYLLMMFITPKRIYMLHRKKTDQKHTVQSLDELAIRTENAETKKGNTNNTRLI